jgi:hypothetical protein
LGLKRTESVVHDDRYAAITPDFYRSAMSTPRLMVTIAIGVVTLGVLSGCSLVTGGAKSPTASATGTAASPAPSTASHQKQLTAVPTDCPPPDEISVSVHVSLPYVDSNPIDGALECTYVDPSKGNASEGLVILFSPTKGATVAQWATQVQQAAPSAVAVPGVGDGAFYTQVSGVGAMNFYSGAVAGYVYSSNFVATQANLTALVADQILVPD